MPPRRAWDTADQVSNLRLPSFPHNLVRDCAAGSCDIRVEAMKGGARIPVQYSKTNEPPQEPSHVYHGICPVPCIPGPPCAQSLPQRKSWKFELQELQIKKKMLMT